MTTFGQRMRALMKERELSLRKLAKMTFYDVSLLSKVSRDLKPPSERLAEILDKALGADGELEALRPQPAPRATQKSHPSLWPALPVDLNGHFSPEDEERLITAARTPRRQDPAVADALATVLAGQRHTEDHIGPAPLLAPVQAQLISVQELVTEARGRLRARVLDVGSQWAQFGGWLHATTGDLNGARAWFDRAAEWAAEVPGPTGRSMIAAIHSYHGHLAWKQGKIGPMIGQSQAAQRVSGAHPVELTFAAIQEARGHALCGDQGATERALDNVSEFAERSHAKKDDAPPWAYFHGDGFYLLGRGAVYRFLAEGSQRYTERSVELLKAGLNALDSDTRNSEWAAWFVYQLANVYALAGDPDQACRYAKQAATAVKATNGIQMLARLRHLQAKLTDRWPDRSDVAELGEALR